MQIKIPKNIQYALSVLFWLCIWQILSMQQRLGLFVASPLQTLKTFFGLACTGRYWTSIMYTTGRIMAGYLPAVLLATVLSVLTLRLSWLDALLMPVMRLMRTVPVVSFIILALILFSSRYLTQLISLSMALPVIYMNLKTGIRQTDPKLSEMASSFRVPKLRRLRYLYLPSVMPAFETCTALALGFAWKSGIAAEVIGIPVGSIGERLQQAKVYLDTPALFAWTLTLVLLSVISEKIWRLLLRGILKAACTDRERDASDWRKRKSASEQTSAIAASATLSPKVLQLDRISKSYDEIPVLSGFSSSLSSDRVYAVMGPSGSGKTTLLRILGGLERPDSGSILMTPGSGGHAEAPENIDKEHASAFPVSFMFQEDRLLEYLDAAANIRFTSPGCSRARAAQVLKELGIPEAELSKPVRDFSGGMKRRVALARTLLDDSQVLLMDEPFKGLDEQTMQKAVSFMLKKRNGRLLVISTHSKSEASLCNASLIWINS